LIDGYATRFLREMFAEYVVLFVGYTLHRIDGSHLAQSHGVVIGRFLRILFDRAQSLSYACDEARDVAIEALTNGAVREDILRVAEHLARLGCPNAKQLWDRANEM
jgi:hypothetical protein